MKQEVTLTLANVNSDGSIEIAITWNEATHSKAFPDAAALRSDSEALLSTPDDAIRWLLYYVLNLGTAPEDLASQVGKKLILDVRPAVQQTISLV